jgi:hypothetical protein
MAFALIIALLSVKLYYCFLQYIDYAKTVYDMHTEYRLPRTSIASEQSFMEWRDRLPGFRAYQESDQPLIDIPSAQAVADTLTQSDDLAVEEGAQSMSQGMAIKKRLHAILGRDIGALWQSMRYADQMRIHVMAYGNDERNNYDYAIKNNGITYQPIYFSPLLRHGFSLRPQAMRHFLGANAGRISTEYTARQSHEAATAGQIYHQSYQLVTEHLLNNRLPHIRTAWGIQRLSRVKCAIVEPYTFQRRWSAISDGQSDAEEVEAYYDGDLHRITLKTSISELGRLSSVAVGVHELLHCLSSASYVKQGDSYRCRRTGLRRFTLAEDTGKQIPRSTHTFLNEFLIERQARICMGIKPEESNGHAQDYIKLGGKLVALANKLSPGVDFINTLNAALYEQPRSSVRSRQRWPATARLGVISAEVFEPGFINRLGAYATEHGAAQAAALLNERRWRDIN